MTKHRPVYILTAHYDTSRQLRLYDALRSAGLDDQNAAHYAALIHQETRQTRKEFRNR